MPSDIEGIATQIRGKLTDRTRMEIDPSDLQEDLRGAAVLIPVIDRPDGPTLLFVQRTDRVPTHKGQIAFPGGALEPEDAGPVEAALRETDEEVALEPDRVEVIGMLDDLLTVTSFVITPVVGIIRNPPDEYVIEEFEVEHAFETPLAHLLDESNLRIERFDWDKVPPGAPVEALRRIRWPDLGHEVNEKDFPMFFFDTPHGTVWGATAVILKQFLQTTFGF